MSDIKTHGILLKKTIMANDDGVLEFFTSDLGKITCFVPKFARSKKKAGELDFFRLLDLDIFKGRNSYRLKQVYTNTIFHGFEKHYTSITTGFEWLGVLHKILPEGVNVSDFFSEVALMLGHVESDHAIRQSGEEGGKNVDYLPHFFWGKLFDFMGIFPRFDSVRNDTVFDISNGKFYNPEEVRVLSKSQIFCSNKSRQVLEFIRRSDFDVFWEKRKNLPESSLENVDDFFLKMREYHLGD